MSLKLMGIFSAFYACLFFMGVLLRFDGLSHLIVGMMFWTMAILIDRIIEGRKWNVNVVIKERRGNYSRRIQDKYRRVKKEGEEWGELRKKKTRIRPIPLNFIEDDERGRHWTELFSPAPGEYHPMKIDKKTMRMKAKIDPYFVNWTIGEGKKALQKWKKEGMFDSLIKFLPLIIVFVISIIGLVIYTDQLIKLAEPAIAVSARASDALEHSATAMEELNKTITILQEHGLLPLYNVTYVAPPPGG